MKTLPERRIIVTVRAEPGDWEGERLDADIDLITAAAGDHVFIASQVQYTNLEIYKVERSTE